MLGKNKRRKILVGDARFTSLYSVTITQEEAQRIVDESIGLFFKGHSLKVKVHFSVKQTKSKWGTMCWRTIVCNQLGENVGTVLHELAHLQTFGHGKEFKEMHRKLLDVWEPRYDKHV